MGEKYSLRQDKNAEAVVCLQKLFQTLEALFIYLLIYILFM